MNAPDESRILHGFHAHQDNLEPIATPPPMDDILGRSRRAAGTRVGLPALVLVTCLAAVAGGGLVALSGGLIPRLLTATATPHPTGTEELGQARYCGNLDAETCATAIAVVIDQVPGAARSAVVVVATRDPERLSQRGGDMVVLVAFERWDDSDLWFDPPTWVVTQGMLSDRWRVEPWTGSDLPAHFVALLRQAGVGP
jgi:hypothetical protein